MKLNNIFQLVQTGKEVYRSTYHENVSELAVDSHDITNAFLAFGDLLVAWIKNANLTTHNQDYDEMMIIHTPYLPTSITYSVNDDNNRSVKNTQNSQSRSVTENLDRLQSRERSSKDEPAEQAPEPVLEVYCVGT